jgi:hypothetical protein
MHSGFCFSIYIQRDPTNLTETVVQNRASSCSGNLQTQHPYPSTRHRQCRSRSTHHLAVAGGPRAKWKYCAAASQLDRSDDEVVPQVAILPVQCGLVMCDVALAILLQQPHVPFAPVLCVPALPYFSLASTIRLTARELARSCLYAHGPLCVLSGYERNGAGCRRWTRRVRCRRV